MVNKKAGKVIVGSETPTGRPNTDWGNFVWIDTANRQVKTFNGSAWEVVVDFADTIGTNGYSGTIKHTNKDMVFENGLLVKYG
jgi:hypothetical protein